MTSAIGRELRSSWKAILLAPALFLFCSFAAAEQLDFRFIGNMAFHITDGSTSLLTDFPYTSGAFGYMKYSLTDTGPVRDGLCLITHAHADHWDPALFSQTQYTIIAPPEILTTINSGKKVPFERLMKYKNIRIEAFATPHKGEHYSYLVIWNGIRMFFTGDTEETTTLLSMKKLDVAFISPWLLNSLKARNARIDAKKVFVYHHTEKEAIVDYQNRIVPNQGDTFRIEGM